MKHTHKLSLACFLIAGFVLGFGVYVQATGSTSTALSSAQENFTLFDGTESTLKSDPITNGKADGGILTAGEFNRVLELLGTGSGGSTSSTGSIKDGWPDAIKCDMTAALDNVTEAIFILTVGQNNLNNAGYQAGDVFYTLPSSAANFNIIFNQDKTFRTSFVHHNGSPHTMNTTCDSKSISTLETEGKAVYFGGSTSTSAINGKVIITETDNVSTGHGPNHSRAIATCPAAKQILTGGCAAGGTNVALWFNSILSGGEGWECKAHNISGAGSTTVTATAVCID